jgi:hypothetical protein
MAIIHVWGWKHDPDEETAKRTHGKALEEARKAYLTIFPNEHAEIALGGTGEADSDDCVHIVIDCSFDISLVDSVRKGLAEIAISDAYRDALPEGKGNVKATLQ